MIGIPWQLGQWRVFEVQLPGRPDRTRHFAGYSVALRAPKIAGPIVEFDLSTKRGTDETGGVFALIGVSRASADVDKEWDAWVRRTGATAVKDVSKDVNKAWVTYPGSEVVDWRQHEHARLAPAVKRSATM